MLDESLPFFGWRGVPPRGKNQGWADLLARNRPLAAWQAFPELMPPRWYGADATIAKDAIDDRRLLIIGTGSRRVLDFACQIRSLSIENGTASPEGVQRPHQVVGGSALIEHLQGDRQAAGFRLRCLSGHARDHALLPPHRSSGAISGVLPSLEQFSHALLERSRHSGLRHSQGGGATARGQGWAPGRSMSGFQFVSLIRQATVRT